MRELFVSLARPDGHRAGVFEHDGAAGYFYRYDPSGPAGARILDALRVVSGPCGLEEPDVEVRWDATESIVGLLIRGRVGRCSTAGRARSSAGTTCRALRRPFPPASLPLSLGRECSLSRLVE